MPLQKKGVRGEGDAELDLAILQAGRGGGGCTISFEVVLVRYTHVLAMLKGTEGVHKKFSTL